MTGHACTPFFWRINLQTGTDQSSAVTHDVDPQTPLGFRLTWKSDAVIDDAQNHLIFHALQSDHNFSCLRMLVGVNDCFTSNAVDLTCGDVILNTERWFEFQPAGYPPDFPVNQISQCIDETGRVDIDTMQGTGKITRVSCSIVHQLCDFFDISCVDDAVILQSQRDRARHECDRRKMLAKPIV